MKFICLYIALFILLQNCWSQNSREEALIKYKKDIPATSLYKSNPFCMIVGPIYFTSEYRLMYEQITAKKQSFQIGFSYLGKNSMLRAEETADTLMQQNNLKYRVSGFRIQASYRFYLSDNFPAGLYVSPHVSYSNARIKLKQNGVINHDNFLQAVFTNYNFMIGYQKLINDVLVFDIFGGIGYKDNSWMEYYQSKYSALDEKNLYIWPEPIKISLGFNLGLAF